MAVVTSSGYQTESFVLISDFMEASSSPRLPPKLLHSIQLEMVSWKAFTHGQAFTLALSQ